MLSRYFPGTGNLYVTFSIAGNNPNSAFREKKTQQLKYFSISIQVSDEFYSLHCRSPGFLIDVVTKSCNEHAALPIQPYLAEMTSHVRMGRKDMIFDLKVFSYNSGTDKRM